MRVLGDVLGGGQGVLRVLQRQHTGLLQQDQGAAAVAALVGDGDGGAIRQFLERLVLAGVSAEGFDVHALDDHQVGALAAVEVVQVGLGLEVVGVQVLLVHLQVGLHVVGEDLHFEVHAFLGQLGFDQLEDFRVGYRSGGDGEFLAGLGEGGGQGGGQGGQQQGLLHEGPFRFCGPGWIFSRERVSGARSGYAGLAATVR
ncbi:hypothetical protein D3C84_731750 [compost metagenome]